MATLTIPNSFTALATIRSADMNANFQAVATFLNSTKLDGTNLQTTVADASTIELASSILRVKDAGITRAKLAAVGQQLSSSSSTYGPTATSSFADVTNLTVTITTTGRPVWVGLVSDGGGNAGGSYINFNSSGVGNQSYVKMLRGATEVARYQFATTVPSGGSNFAVPPGVVWHIDVPSAGTYTYKVQQAKDSGTSGTVTANFTYCKLVAYEIG